MRLFEINSKLKELDIKIGKVRVSRNFYLFLTKSLILLGVTGVVIQIVNEPSIFKSGLTGSLFITSGFTGSCCHEDQKELKRLKKERKQLKVAKSIQNR